MSRYPSDDAARFDQQFRESRAERNDHLRARRDDRRIASLLTLIADLSVNLRDEGCDYSVEGLENVRRRVANALPPAYCPQWLEPYRDPTMVQS